MIIDTLCDPTGDAIIDAACDRNGMRDQPRDVSS